MGKAKSIVVTTLVCLCTLALVLLSTLSFSFSGGIRHFNSLLDTIKLGAEFTGEATITIYPEGVISSSDYYFGMPEDADEAAEYAGKYTQVGGVFVESNKVTEDNKAKVAQDAQVLNQRFGKKGYTSYSVSVVDDYSIAISVPTGFSFAEYRQNDTDTTTKANTLTRIEETVTALTMSGKLTLRNSEVGNNIDNDKYNGTFSLASKTDNLNSYFKGINVFSNSKQYAVKCDLTKVGAEKFAQYASNAASASEDAAKNMLFYIGTEQLISLSATESLTEKAFYISVSSSADSAVNKSIAENYAIILSSVVEGNVLQFDYNVDGENIKTVRAQGGNLPAIMALVAMTLVLVATVAFFVAKYKKFGYVYALMSVIYAVTMIVATQVCAIQVTTVVLLVQLLGYGLMTASTLYTMQAIRRHTTTGKTMQSSIKEGYKEVFGGLLDIHVVLTVVGIVFALIGNGVVGACGVMLLIATLASYAIYWFTRFMWYNVSSPIKDKFAFAGYKREVYEDD